MRCWDVKVPFPWACTKWGQNEDRSLQHTSPWKAPWDKFHIPIYLFQPNWPVWCMFWGTFFKSSKSWGIFQKNRFLGSILSHGAFQGDVADISQLVFSCEKSYFNSSTPLTGVSADPQRISLSKSATEVMSKSWRWPRLVVRAEVEVGQSVSEPYNFWGINNDRKKSNCIESHQLPFRVFQAGERLLPCTHMWRNRGNFYPLQFASACHRRVWSCKVEILTIFIFILAVNWYLCRCWQPYKVFGKKINK